MANGRIKSEDIDEVRERNDIVEVVSSYVRLKKTGSKFKGLCPFHQEKDPSFTVDPAKQLFYCFGCREGGNVFTFIQKKEGLEFRESVEKLADRVGYRLTYLRMTTGERERVSLKDGLHRLNRLAAEYYHYLLMEDDRGKMAREYLAERGLGEETRKQFKLGLALSGWENFCEFARKKGFNDKDIITGGLGVKREDGRSVYDRFRQRIIFPIHDIQGRVVAFGGRILGEGTPKYLNSPETPVYVKGKILYGLYQAKSDISSQGEAILVEGYTDLLVLHQAGIKGVVASLGTALTENHFGLVNRFADRLYLCFDADAAGLEAALRPLEFFTRFSLEVFVISLPGGEDPASLVEEGGAEAFLGLKEKAESLLDFSVKRLISKRDTGSPMSRKRALEDVAPVVARLKGAEYKPIRDDIVCKICEWLDMDGDTVEVILREASRARSAGARREVSVAPRLERVEEEALRVLVHDERVLREHLAYLEEDFFTTEERKNLINLLRELVVADNDDDREKPGSLVQRLIDMAESESMRNLVAGLAAEPPPPGSLERAEEIFQKLQYLFLKKRIKSLEEELARVNKEIEPKKYDAICDELMKLVQLVKIAYSVFDHS